MGGNFGRVFKNLKNQANEAVESDFADIKIPQNDKTEKPKQTQVPKTVVVSLTKISSTMEVYGDIKSKDSIQAEGQIYGNVATTQTFSTSNLTLGNVNALNVVARNARIKGYINAAENVEIGAGTIMVGDVRCGSIQILGKIKGDCDVRHDAAILSGSLLAGDLVADSITTEQGARVNGNVTMRNNDMILDLDSEFDLGGDF